jgi:hypothetical protein
MQAATPQDFILRDGTITGISAFILLCDTDLLQPPVASTDLYGIALLNDYGETSDRGKGYAAVSSDLHL